MTPYQILTSFETEIGKINDSVNKPLTTDSLYWINQAVAKFVKLRFNGDFVHKTGFEQTEKRREDLINLFKEHSYFTQDFSKDLKEPNYDSYAVTYPNDFLYILNEDVVITDDNDEYKTNTHVFECTRDSYMHRINNSLTDFHYIRHKARPLRIRTEKGCELLTDKNYKIYSYTIGYLRKPNIITLTDPSLEYTDFNDNVMYEIIKIAAQMYIENTQDKRYESITNEVNTQE